MSDSVSTLARAFSIEDEPFSIEESSFSAERDEVSSRKDSASLDTAVSSAVGLSGRALTPPG